MSSGSSNSSILNMPDYGQGLAEALQAQTDALSGSLTGTSLQQTIEQYERPLRMSAAQIDNDVLRQTLLGGQVPIYESVSSDNLVERRVSQPGEGGQVTQIDYGGAVTKDGRVVTGDSEIPEPMREFKEILARTPTGSRSDNFELSNAVQDWSSKHADFLNNLDPEQLKQSLDFTYQGSDTSSNPLNNYEQQISAGKNPARAWTIAQIQNFNRYGAGYANEAFGKFSTDIGTPEPIYKKNEDGTDFVVPRDENGDFILEATSETEIPEGGVAAPAGELTGYTRAGTGLVDMLGDSRKALDPTTGLESDRMAGFDADGNFLGLAALAEDIQRGNLSRQREADLADVERLSSRYQDVMADYKPETAAALSDAGDILQEQKNTLTGGGAITVPTDSTYGGDIEAGTMTAAQVGAAPDLTAGTSYTAAQVADPMALTAATSYDPSASVTGDGYTATANLEGGNVGADSLRAALLADAETALSQGLTEREQAKISNAARARSTMMGRTFDQSGAIAEAQALVGEDNNRRMQNRGFAGQTLGREADIQRSDLDRGLQANIRNQDALNRAAEFGASQNMQAQLANQAATNQALSQGLTAGLSQEALAAQQQQAKAMADATAANRASEFGVGSGMQQDALRAQLGQQTNLAQAELQQQANAFGADAAQRASQVNQAQRQQANQFGTGATMDAQRLNEQLKQSGTLGYVDAATRLAALEDQQTLDPFQALLGRAGGGSLQAGQGVFGQAGYGLQSGPQYMNPEAGLGYISSMAANQANMYAANQAADAARSAGMMNMFGGIIGGIAGGAGQALGGYFQRPQQGVCWVAREVYGPTNPAWLQFREWMFTESPNWFFKLYAEYGERFANWISNKPRIKSIIRKWMNSKIGAK
jgi:hypothetical protein